MRWLMMLLLLGGASAGLWWLATDRANTPQEEMSYVLDVERGEVVPRRGLVGKDPAAVVSLGLLREAPRPRHPLPSSENWMGVPLDLPRKSSVSGKELLDAMSKVVPIRFLTQSEIEQLSQQSFELGTDKGETVYAQMFADLVQHAGLTMQVADNFVFIHDPKNAEKELRGDRGG